MKKILYSAIILALLSAISFISGCKKSTSVNGHVQTITDGSSVTTFTYDSQGRLSTATNANGTNTITYSSGSVSISAPGGGTVVYTLNGQGLATSDNQGNTYSYDGNGYLTSIVNSSTTGGTTTTTTSNYSITNGNVTSITTNNTTQDSYTYTTTPDYRDYGLYFLGKNSVPFGIGSGKSTDLVNTDVEGAVTYTYSYTFDSQGRPQTKMVVGNGGTATNVYTYTTN